LLEDTGVACTAGVDFDPEEGQKFLRLSYAGSADDIRNACQRINDWLPRLAKSA
jgi:aspartate/methionine/tyrosine aminotransferase